jgi:hypothetical protein
VTSACTFSNSCEGLEEIYSELEQFTGTSDDAHDDIVSGTIAAGRSVRAYADMGSKIEGVSLNFVADQQAEEIHNLVHCLGKYAHLSSAGQGDDNPVTAYQVENTAQPASMSYHDPLGDLMG